MSSVFVKTSSNVYSKDKRKNILVEKSVEENKRLQEKEIEKQRKINIILCQRMNNPPRLNKGDPKKH